MIDVSVEYYDYIQKASDMLYSLLEGQKKHTLRYRARRKYSCPL